MKQASVILIAVLFLASPLLAGVVFEIETTDHTESPPQIQTVRMSGQGHNLKMDITSDKPEDQGEMIYRGDRGEMVMISHAEKSYFVMDREAVSAMASQMSQAMRQMEEALKNVPESQRAQIEQMMKQRMPSAAQGQQQPSELRKTGEKGTRAGYPCVRYEVWREGQKIRELWVTNWSNLEGGEEVAEVFQQMAGFFEEMMESLSQATGGLGGSAAIGENIFEHMSKLGGLPVVTRDFENGALESESTLRSSKRQALESGVFEVPAGYRQQSMGPGARR
jgi:hypothetical protein